MRYADLFARVTGFCVAVAGTALAGRELLVGPADTALRIGAGVLADLTVPATATVVVGVAFVVAGLAVLAGRGRSVAVSVGGGAAVVVVASLAVSVGSPAVILSVGAVALALLFAGAATGEHAAG